jgi:competence protein ComFC
MHAPAPTTLKSWLDAAAGFFYPPHCQICRADRAEPGEGFVCPDCRRSVKWLEPPWCDRCGLPFEGDLTTEFECANCREMELYFQWARAAVAADGTVLEVIHRYKYQQSLWFEPFLAGLLAERAVPLLRESPCDVIVPVPLHPLKKREREFNQAERLGNCLGRALKIPVDTRLIERVEYTRTQTRLDRPQRAANVRRAFAMRPGATLCGGRVLVVDDVMTTGATTSACAKILRDAGAEEVVVLTVARGLRGL